MMIRAARKVGLVALFCSLAFFAFALAPYPSLKAVEEDLKANWKIEGDQGKWISATKASDWKKKVIVRDEVPLTIAFINYTVRVEFPYFFRDFDVNVVYIYASEEWIFDANEILHWEDEQKEGVVELPERDEVKALIKEAFQKAAQSFFDGLSTTLEPVAPVSVLKVLITEPEVKGADLTYFADVEFLESKPGLFAKPKTFIYENLKVDLIQTETGRKLMMRTYAGELKLK